MALAQALSSTPPLVIDRAIVRASGREAGGVDVPKALKRGLQRALASSSLDGLGLGQGEYLLVARLAVEERVEAGGLNRAFSRTFSRRLRDCLDKAELDPSGPVANGRAVRFSSLPRLAAWLIGEPRPSAPYVAGLIADLPSARTARDWIAETVLPDAPVAAQTARILIEREQFGQFLATLTPRDLGVLERGLEQQFGVASQVDTPAYRAAPASPTIAAKPDPKARRLSALKAQLTRDFSHAAIAPRAKRVGAALAFVGTLPSAARGDLLRHFIADVIEPPPQPASVPAAALSVASPARIYRPAEEDEFTASPPASQPHKSSHRPSAGGRAEHPLRGDPKSLLEAPQAKAPTSPPSALRSQAFIQPEQEITPWPEDIVTFTSPFCGLLFLTNILRDLGFVVDFGMEQRADPTLAPFELIDAVGQLWFGREYRASPLHVWLASEAARRWVPQDFTHPLLEGDKPADASCSLVRDRSRLTVWHRSGFPLMDASTRADSRSAAMLVRSVGRTAFAQVRAVRPSARQKLPRHGRRRWMAALAQCLVREMERRSAGFELSPEDLRLPGQMRITDGQITVHLDLADLPFAARAAGLDRNPGWIKEEGRSLAFVYT